jgi:CelD/BcsL family acetyltransferase involved in cellulose biosynthesis
VEAYLVDEPDDVLALGPAWRELAERAKARPFQDHAWCASWQGTHGAARGRRPCVAILRSGRRLLAVLPLARGRYGGLRVLEWMGAKPSDYCDALVDPSIEPRAALRRLWREVARRGFDLAHLARVPADATCWALLEGLGGWATEGEYVSEVPITWPDGRAWLRGLSKPSRELIGRRLRRLASAGVTFRVGAAAGDRAELVETVLRHKVAMVEAAGTPGFLTEPGGPEFVRAMAAAMAGRGLLHLSALRSDEAVAAAHLGFLHEGTLYYYMPAFDPAWAKHGPGHLLLASLVMWCCDNGVRRLDLLSGDEPYKRRFRPRVMPPTRSVLVPGSVLGRAALTGYRLLGRSGARHAGAVPRDDPDLGTPG